MSKQKYPVTGKGRVSFPSVYEPDTFGDSAPKYKITLLFDPDDPCLEEIKEVVEKAVAEKWKVRPTFDPDHYPISDGDEKSYAGYAGKIAVKFSNRSQPKVVGGDKQFITRESGMFYAGCYARVSYSAYAYDNRKKGVLLTFYNVQKMGDGDPLGGGYSDPDDDFDLIEEEYDSLID